MQLSITERILLLSSLPKEGSIATVRLVRELRESLSFSEDEHQELGLIFNEQGARWDQSKNDYRKEVAIGSTMEALIKSSLHGLDKQKKLTEAHIDLFERFVGNDE